MRKITLINAAIIILAIIGFWATAVMPSNKPMSANGMTKQERLANDAGVLQEELADYGVVTVEINYSNGSIIVRTDRDSSEQYSDRFGQVVEDAVEEALDSRRSELTLEKDDYFIFIESSDDRTLNW